MASDVLGYVSLHLHAHLPFVRHPEYQDFLEEDWLYEAISETYLPLLKIFDRLTDEGIPFRISMTMTPPLVAMLRDELLMGRYAKRLDALCELAPKDIWDISYLSPLSDAWRIHWAGHWPVSGWQNTTITASLLILAAVIAVWRGVSPAGLFSARA